jgi:hypothetical protein
LTIFTLAGSKKAAIGLPQPHCPAGPLPWPSSRPLRTVESPISTIDGSFGLAGSGSTTWARAGSVLTAAGSGWALAGRQAATTSSAERKDRKRMG